jgi:hypothetical protein
MRYTLLVVFGALVLLSTGCDSRKHRVTGTITFDDEPITEGYIAFIPEEGGQGGGGKIANGRYTLLADRGRNRVEIHAVKKMTIIGPDGQPTEDKGGYIPAKYNRETTLKTDITASTTLDFSLTSK